MSWDCSICGKGREADHTDCANTGEIVGAIEGLRQVVVELTEELKRRGMRRKKG